MLTVEDHDTNGVLNRGGVARFAKHTRQGVKAQFFPKLIECPNITECQRGLKSQLRGLGHGGGHAFGAQQAFEQGVHLAAHFIQAA
jgi:hypothetical protein